MFSGIIQNKGIVERKIAQKKQMRFIFRFSKPEKKLRLGESIAVNGACLTVAKIGSRTFEADIIRETLEATMLGDLKRGDRVNLERSLKFGDRLGGHFVTGHIDGKGILRKIEKRGANRTFFFEAPAGLLKFIVPKGSIAVDGVSLTVQKRTGKLFSVGLVPHTLRFTSLSTKRVGDYVNLEADLIARYLEPLNSFVPKKSQRVSFSTFKKQGF